MAGGESRSWPRQSPAGPLPLPQPFHGARTGLPAARPQRCPGSDRLTVSPQGSAQSRRVPGKEAAPVSSRS